MSDEVHTDHNYRSEHKSLLFGLKTVTEGLLSGQSSNVWNIHGGLNRMCAQLEHIMYHGLKSIKGDLGIQLDFWPVVYSLKTLNPVLAPALDKVNRSGGNRGSTWLRESLRDHTLSSQLSTLVSNKSLMNKFYFEFAFLNDEQYFKALCVCLKAIELNRISLLAELDLKLLSHSHEQDIRGTRSRSWAVPERKHRNSVGDRKSSSHDAMALAPPFASPKQESILCMSDEHAVPSSIRESTSPEETKSLARESLRTVLRKSGSESPTGDAPDFSFYDNLNSDPLLNIEFSDEVNHMNPSLKEVVSTPQLVNHKSKKVIVRSQSETGMSKTSAVIKNIYKDNEDFSHETPGSVSRLEDIFSDSECPPKGEEKEKVKVKSKGHKRSRSDQGGIKVEKMTQKENKVSTEAKGVVIYENKDMPGEGTFKQPLQGQSLINYLSSQDFHTCANLDKENAHFSISEALIAAIEQMKWNHVISPKVREDPDEEDSDEEINKLKQRIRIRKQQKLREKAKFFPTSSDGLTETATTSKSPSSVLSSSFQNITDSSGSDVEVDEIEFTISDNEQENEGNLSLLKSKGLSLSLASLYSDADLQKVKPDRQSSMEVSDQSGVSAESVAILLLKKFSEKQLPKASDLEWLVPISEAPQELLPLPKSYPISPDDGETEMEGFTNSVIGALRLRGNNEWAPPRSQIIFDIHSNQKRGDVMAKQNFRCAGCGTRVEPAYMKRFRYCEYLGKYFCQCCHTNKVNYIPGHIIRKWDFKQYAVSDFSWRLLSRIFNEPYFNLLTINPALFKKVKVLDAIQALRLQLMYLCKFLKICKYSESIISKIKKEPSHWHEDVDVYSICDLVNIKNNSMFTKLRDLVNEATDHVEECSFCQGFGYICELCRDENDVIFPFQLHTVTVCKDCSSCFHKACYIEGKCPKCSRLEARRRQLQETEALDSSGESDT
ncbi:run domain Beclin-1-interacting and cysteine-rich domain-containing protein-like [Saccostrea echinata]|uniref:run domain Beclin-1-interacting and cysteine-rich domain-containing protein-like n=1 Tax=Saccostrea echinata TaxID=191078 RepID=UPI002A825C75|nr:run domain Beclin-1-interacting and cysteine-rich domain-containing protein-like [Saccostrea echinata]